MDFGMALIALKRGETVARKGWNGKGMFLTLQEGSTVDGSSMRNEGARKYYEGTQCAVQPHIDMKAADGTYVVGWLASQTDMLAEDWEIVNPIPCKLAQIKDAKESAALVHQLAEVREIVKLGLEGIKREFVVVGSERPYKDEALRLCNEYCEKAEAFLKEASE